MNVNQIGLYAETVEILEKNNILNVEQLMELTIEEINSIDGMTPTIALDIMFARARVLTNFDKSKEENENKMEDSSSIFEWEGIKIPRKYILDDISKLNLNVRAFKILKSNGINTLQDLIKYNTADLLSIHNFTKTYYKHIVYMITEYIQAQNPEHDDNPLIDDEQFFQSKNDYEEKPFASYVIPDEYQAIDIFALKLRGNILRALKNKGINTISDLIPLTKTELTAINGITVRTIEEIEKSIENLVNSNINPKKYKRIGEGLQISPQIAMFPIEKLHICETAIRVLHRHKKDYVQDILDSTYADLMAYAYIDKYVIDDIVERIQNISEGNDYSIIQDLSYKDISEAKEDSVEYSASVDEYEVDDVVNDDVVQNKLESDEIRDDNFDISLCDYEEKNDTETRIRIELLPLSKRASNCLKRNGINYLDELEKMSSAELEGIRNMGEKTLLEIQNLLKGDKDLFLNDSNLYDGNLNELHLSTRTLNCLIQNGITSVEQLLETPNDEFLKLRNLGKKSYEELKSIKSRFVQEEPINQDLVDDLKNISIEEANLSVRAYNSLKRMNVNNIGELIQLSIDDLQNARNIGKKTIDEIINLKCDYIEKYSSDLIVDDVEYKKLFDLLGSILSSYYINKLISMGLTYNVFVTLSESELTLVLKSNGFLDEINSIIQTVQKYILDNQINKNSLIKDVMSDYNIIYELSILIRPLIDLSPCYILYKLKKAGCLEELNKNEIDNYTNGELFSIISNVSEVEQAIKGFLSGLADFNSGIKLDYLNDALTNCGFEEKLSNIIEYCLVASGWYFNLAGWYYPNSMSLEEYLNSLEESREKDVLVARLNGNTLQEIGDQYSITRERARQISVKRLNYFPVLREDIFKEAFEFFLFKKDTFLECFGLTNEKIYEYLGIRYKHGKHSLIEEEIEKYEGKLKEIISEYRQEGKKRKLRKWDIVKEIIIKNAGHYISKEQFEKEYYQYISDNNLNELKYKTNINGLFSRLRLSKHVAFDKEGNLRYFEYNAMDLWDKIDFSVHNDSVISAEVLYRENKDLMDEYDIWNGYELYHLLKATYNDENDFIKYIKYSFDFRRIPTIVIGNGDESKQIKRLLKELAPISYWDLFAAYEERYGVQKETAASALYKYVSLYSQNGVFEYAVSDIADEDVAKFKLKLNEKDFWSIEEVEKEFRIICTHSKDDALNYVSFRRLGYELSTGGYVYNKKYSSAQECFEAMFNCEGIIDVSNAQKYYQYGAFFGYIAKLDSSFNYIEIAPKKYMTIEKAKTEYGITLEEMIDFISDIGKSHSDKFYNAHSLMKIIEKHPFYHKVNNNEIICTSVLRKEENALSCSLGGNIILSKIIEPSIVSVVEWLLTQNDNISLQDLQQLFNDSFGTHITIWKIKEKIKEANLFEKYFGNAIDDYISNLKDIDDIDSFFDEEFL